MHQALHEEGEDLIASLLEGGIDKFTRAEDGGVDGDTFRVIMSIVQDVKNHVNLVSETDIFESIPAVIRGLSFRERSILLPMLQSIQTKERAHWYLALRADDALWKSVLPESPQRCFEIGWRDICEQ
jgi:hypothetical protein